MSRSIESVLTRIVRLRTASSSPVAMRRRMVAVDAATELEASGSGPLPGCRTSLARSGSCR
jgi:hypothetical protein